MANRTLIGDFGGGDYRIRISKPGYDVTAALQPEQLAFDSTWKDGAVIYRIGVISVVSTAAPFYTEFPFGETLPSIPFVYYWQVSSSTEIFVGAEATDDQNYRPYCGIATTTGFKIFGSGVGTFCFMVLRSMTND